MTLLQVIGCQDNFTIRQANLLSFLTLAVRMGSERLRNGLQMADDLECSENTLKTSFYLVKLPSRGIFLC